MTGTIFKPTREAMNEKCVERIDEIHHRKLQTYAFAFTDEELEEAKEIWSYWGMEQSAGLAEELLQERQEQ